MNDIPFKSKSHKMRINRKELLFGVPILKIREVLRYAMMERLSFETRDLIIEEVARLIKQPVNIAKGVFNHLIREEYLIMEHEKTGNDFYWKVSETEKGRRLGVTKANPPISREKADQLLKELLERAAEINRNEDLAYIVETVKVFGSYLSEEEVLGDIDVAVTLSRRDNNEVFKQKSDARIKLANKNGRHFSNIVDRYSWPQREVLLLLSTKKKGLSLHHADEIIDRTEYKLVYQYKK